MESMDELAINGFDPERSANKMFDCVLTIFSSSRGAFSRSFTRVTSVPIAMLAFSFFIYTYVYYRKEFSLDHLF